MGFQRSLLPAAVLVLLLLAGGAAAQKCSIHAAARAKVAMEAEAAAAGSDELTVLAAALAGRATAATAETAAAAAEPQQTAAGLARGDLPKRRPRQPWPYRALSTALSAPKPATDSKGVTSIVVEHAPLTNVTTDMLTWWFNQDLQRVAPYVGDNKTHSLYLQWHPKDHCNQKVVSHTGTSRQGDTWKLQEFVIASKAFTYSSYKGFDAPSEAQLNQDMVVSRLDGGGLTLQLRLLSTVLTKGEHTWSNSPQGARVKTVFKIGSPSLGSSFNRVINCQFSRNEDPLVMARKLQLHAVQEFGNFPHILPELYKP